MAGWTVLHSATFYTRSVELIEALSQADLTAVDLNAREMSGFTASEILKIRKGPRWAQLAKGYGFSDIPQKYRRMPNPDLDQESEVVEALEGLFDQLRAARVVQIEPDLRHRKPQMRASRK